MSNLIQEKINPLRTPKGDFKDLKEATDAYNRLLNDLNDFIRIIGNNQERFEIWADTLIVNSRGLLGTP